MNDWEIRHDEDGRVEDVVVGNVDTFRLERLDHDRWRACCSLHDGTQVVFRFAAERIAPGSVEAQRALEEKLAAEGRLIVVGDRPQPVAKIVVTAEIEEP
jgi:hypothetical protein